MQWIKLFRPIYVPVRRPKWVYRGELPIRCTRCGSTRLKRVGTDYRVSHVQTRHYVCRRCRQYQLRSFFRG